MNVASGQALSLLACHSPTAEVVWRSGVSLTLAQLRHGVACLAEALPPAEADDQILVICTDRWEFSVALLAAWHRGYSVALPPNLQPQSLRELQTRAGIRWKVQAGGALKAWRLGAEVDVPISGSPRLDLPLTFELDPSQALATLHTSGTTGQSVGIRKSALQLLGEAGLLARLLSVGVGARVMLTAPPQHIYGLLVGVLVPLLSGGALVCGETLLPEAMAELARASQATHLVSTPAHLRALVLSTGAVTRGLDRLRTVVSSGAPLDGAVAQALSAGSRDVIELLGSTETGGIAARAAPHAPWRPLDGVRVEVDPEGRMIVESPFLDLGGPRPFVTSDQIALRPEGTFEHLGRSDGVIKIGGKRVTLQELENHLRGLPGVLDAALRSFPSSDARGREIWAMVVAPHLDAGALRTSLLATFDPVVLPRRLRLLDRLPRELSGKITAAAWIEAFEGRPERSTDGRPESSTWVDEVEVHERQLQKADAAADLQVRLRLPDNLSYFRGHFDGLPILSGIFILNQLVVRESRRTWPELGVVRGLSRVKFRRPLFPRAEVAMTLRRRDRAPAVEFSLRSGEHECSCGEVLFGEPT